MSTWEVRDAATNEIIAEGFALKREATHFSENFSSKTATVVTKANDE